MNSKLQNLLISRGIESLFHFTHIYNLPQIMKNGLLTKKNIIESDVTFKETDPDRHDGVIDSISLSLSKPNSWMFNRKQEKFDYELIILELPSNILENYPFIAFPSNAARNDLKKMRSNSPSDFAGVTGIDNLFLNRSLRVTQQIPDNEPTDIQSEILIQSNLPSELISRIHIDNREIERLKQKYSFVFLFPDVQKVLHKNCNCSFFDKPSSNQFDGRRFEEWWKQSDGK